MYYGIEWDAERWEYRMTGETQSSWLGAVEWLDEYRRRGLDRGYVGGHIATKPVTLAQAQYDMRTRTIRRCGSDVLMDAADRVERGALVDDALLEAGADCARSAIRLLEEWLDHEGVYSDYHGWSRASSSGEVAEGFRAAAKREQSMRGIF